jgi:hypothetical protein
VLNLIAKDLLADKGRAAASGTIIEILNKFRNVGALVGALKNQGWSQRGNGRPEVQ